MLRDKGTKEIAAIKTDFNPILFEIGYDVGIPVDFQEIVLVFFVCRNGFRLAVPVYLGDGADGSFLSVHNEQDVVQLLVLGDLLPLVLFCHTLNN